MKFWSEEVTVTYQTRHSHQSIRHTCLCQTPAGTLPISAPLGLPLRLLGGNLMEQQLCWCYFSFISLRGCLLIMGSKQKTPGRPSSMSPFSQQRPNAIVNFWNLIVDAENRSVNLIEAPARKRIYPFPRSKAPPGQPLPMHTGSKETQNAPHTSSHTHPRGHSNIIRYKPIIQAISLSLMMCQHSLSVFFFLFFFSVLELHR